MLGSIEPRVGDSMLYTINDKPYIDFEYLGIDYDRIYWEAVEFMMTNPKTLLGWNGGQHKTIDDHPDIVHPEEVEYTKEDDARIAGLSLAQRRLYNKIVKKAYYPWVTYNLNEFKFWPERQDRRDRFHPATIKAMPYFVETLESLSIFEHLGWARIYTNEAFNFVHIHRDWSDKVLVDEFIYFNLSGKTIYLRHYDKEERVGLDAKALYFDARNLHGTDPEPCFNFSIRVDGKFTQEFRNSLNYSRLAGPDRDGEIANQELCRLRGKAQPVK
jgi:hypothetical protein